MDCSLTACDCGVFIRSSEKPVDHSQVSILVQCWEENPEENDQAGLLCCELLLHCVTDNVGLNERYFKKISTYTSLRVVPYSHIRYLSKSITNSLAPIKHSLRILNDKDIFFGAQLPVITHEGKIFYL